MQPTLELLSFNPPADIQQTRQPKTFLMQHTVLGMPLDGGWRNPKTKDTFFCQPISVRFYKGKASLTACVEVCLPDEQGKVRTYFRQARVTGSGYDRQSAAAEAAFEAVGLKFSGRITSTYSVFEALSACARFAGFEVFTISTVNV